MYNSTTTGVLQPQFGQTHPATDCHSKPFNLEFSTGQCGNARCSWECYSLWSKRQALILNYFLDEHLPSRMRLFRGNFKLSDDATLNAVKSIKGKFNSRIRNWKRRTANRNTTIEFRAIQHVTAPDKMHFDIVLYSDTIQRNRVFTREIRDLWTASGGARTSLVPQEPDLATAQSHYLTKDLSSKRRKRTRLYLPAKNGSHISWQTGNFYQGREPQDIFRDWKCEWFGEESVILWESVIQRHKRYRQDVMSYAKLMKRYQACTFGKLSELMWLR